jgi:predicted GNAT family acetyltransferase
MLHKISRGTRYYGSRGSRVIRLLAPEDRDIAQSYLDWDPLHNIYLIHGLQAHGLESKRVTFWGAFKGDRLAGILFTHNDSQPRFGCLAGDDPEVLAQLGKLALASGIRTLLGRSTYVRPAVENLCSRAPIDMRRFNFYQIQPGQLVRRGDYPVRAATEEDIPLLTELYRDYEFRNPNRTEREIEREIRRAVDEGGHYFLVELEGRAVSAARIAPETDRAGVIGAARTLPEFRGRGIYLSVRTACFEHLFGRGKIGLGFFAETNASMEQVVKKQGGDIIARWLIVDFKKRPPLRRRILPLRVRRWGLRIKDRVSRQ